MIRAEVGERKGSRQRIYAVKLYAGPCVPKSGTKYSHNHAINETAERAGLNVQNVWTFRDIADEDWPIYNRATIECGAGVRESRLNKFNPGIL